jgi:TatD DNase family protein
LIPTHHHELPLFEELLPTTRYIGEVGLDFSKDHITHRDAQLRTLERIADMVAGAGDKILSLHSRGAEREVVELFGDAFPATLILHWYSGSLRVLEQAAACGFYFSVNHAMCRSRRGRP